MTDLTRRSFMVDSWIIHRQGDPIMFDFKKDGRAIIRMDGYLICPKEMFSQRQVKMAYRKYKKQLDATKTR